MAAVREDMGEVPEVHIRPMMDLDLTEVSAIEQKSYAFPWSENIFRDCLRVGYTCRALDLAGQVIGYGVMSLGAGEAHILNVCVREEFRSVGFGRRLLEQHAVRAHALGHVLERDPGGHAAVRVAGNGYESGEREVRYRGDQ